MHVFQGWFYKCIIWKNAFCTKYTMFKPWSMLIFIENCRDVTFSNWLLTLMLPLISAYGNAPELKALQTNRIKCTFFKVDFTNVSFEKMHFARNIQCSNLEVCWFSLKIVGMSRFQTGFWPLCYRLYLHTATLQSLRLSKQIE